MNKQPNIIMLVADQLRRQALRCYGDTNSTTSHIDAIASEGVRFTNACSTFPVCVPFRFTWMTGEYAHSRWVPSIGYRLSPAERTLAHEWNDAGYHTAYFGKWHLNGGGHGNISGYSNKQCNRTPVRRENRGGWQKWFGFELSNAHFDTCYFEDDDMTPRPLNGYQTDALFDLAIDYLDNEYVSSESPRSAPFSLVLSVEPPHPPYEAPPEYEEKWRTKDLVHAKNWLFDKEANKIDPSHTDRLYPGDEEKALGLERLYYAMVNNFDDNVGKLTSFLKNSGLYDNTIIVIMSDHGHCGGAHGITQKSWPFEEAIGIPFIIRDPREREGERTIDTVISTEDLFPTLLGLTGVTPKKTTPGVNLVPHMRGGSAPPRDGVLLEFTYIPRPDRPFFTEQWRGIRTPQYMYSVIGNINTGGLPWLLYDLENDPEQIVNLVGDPAHEATAKECHALLRKKLEETGDYYYLAPAFGVPALNDWHPEEGAS